MTNFLPEIVEAPEPEPQPEVFVEETPEVDEEEEETNDLDEKLSMNPKESVDNDMFEKVKIKDEQLSEIINEEPPVIVKPVKKPKKVISDKQRNALARNRQILAEKREAIANQKKEIKERITKEVKSKGLPSDGVKVKVNLKPESPPPQNVNVDEAVFNGIQRYETLRKARKVEKKKQKEVEKKNDQLKSTIQHAINGGHKPEANPFDSCFNFTF